MSDDASGTFLEIRRPGDSPARVPLNGSGVTLGRSASASLVLDHPSVSRDHAELTRDASGAWWVRDRGSRNGTTVNGARVEHARVAPGDVIGIGEYALRIVPRGAAGTAASRSAVPAPTDDAPGVTLKVLDDAEPPRIAAGHIAAVMAFGRELHRTADPRGRLRRLLEFAVGPELQGLSASALRLAPARGGGRGPGELDVEPLSDPVHRAGPSTRVAAHVSLSLLRAVVARGQPVLANNLARLSEYQADVSIAGDTTPFSAVACPLHATGGGGGGDVRDVLYVVQPPPLGTAEWLMLNSLAVEQYRQAEAAWDARARAETQAAVARELELARVVQARTLPTRRPDDRLDWALSFSPCHGVGGDYVDVIRRPDGTVLLAIADVSGKGMQAALVTAAIHAVFQTLALTGQPLAAIATAANEHLRRFLPEGAFATLAAVLIDPASGRGECVNAGHPPVLAVAPAGEVRPISGGDNLPLGLADDPLATQPIELADGEYLVLHTDGLNELCDARGAMLGLARLRENVGRMCSAGGGPSDVKSIVAGVSGWLGSYAGGGAASDDQTFLVARRI